MTVLPNSVSKPHSSKWHYALIILVTSVLMLWRLGAIPIDGHEAYVAVTAGNMVDPESWLNPALAEDPIPPNTPMNHWLIPVFNGEPRLVKTPLAYWCVAGLLKLGFPANEFTARLPSALAGVALAVVVLALGRSMFSPRAALLGALMLGTSLACVSWGRNARADMQMTLWMSVAMACVYWALGQSPKWRSHLLLLAAWGALGLANLAKEMAPLFMLLPIGLYLCWRASVAAVEDDEARRALLRYLAVAGAGLVVCILIRMMPFLQWWRVARLSEGMGMVLTVAATIGGPVAWYALRSKAWRQANAILPTALPGAALMLVMFVPWMMYMTGVFPQASRVFAAQTADRALGTGGWVGRSAAPLTGYYLWSLAKWSLPWVVFLPGALAMPLMKRFREDRNGLVLLFLWVFGLVLLFSVSVGKHEQYIIPAWPAACLLIGYCAEDVFFRRRWFGLRLARGIVAGYGIVLLATAIAAVVALAIIEHDARPFAIHVLIIADLALAPAWLALAFVRTRPAAALALMVLSVMLAEIGYFTLNNPWDDRWDNCARMGQRIRNEVPADEKIIAFGNPDAAIVWYAGRELPVAKDLEACLVKRHGKDDGQRLWRQWLQEGRPLWAVVSDRDKDDRDKNDRDRDGFAGGRFDQVGIPVSAGDRQLTLLRRRAPSVSANVPPAREATCGIVTDMGNRDDAR